MTNTSFSNKEIFTWVCKYISYYNSNKNPKNINDYYFADCYEPNRELRYKIAVELGYFILDETTGRYSIPWKSDNKPIYIENNKIIIRKI